MTIQKYTFEERQINWHNWGDVRVNSLIAFFGRPDGVYHAHVLEYATGDIVFNHEFVQEGITKEFLFPAFPLS